MQYLGVCRKDRLKCVDKHDLSFAVSQSCNRFNVAQVVHLASVANERLHFAVVNTHMLFNPKRGDIKMSQMLMLLDSLAAVVSCMRTALLCRDSPLPDYINVCSCGAQTLLSLCVETSISRPVRLCECV